MADTRDPGSAGGTEHGVGRFLYRLALAGVGGLVLAQEEIAGILRRREGEPGPPERPEPPTEPPEPSGESAASDAASSPVLKQLDATVHRVLHSFTLPSRTEVEELEEQIDALAAKVLALQARRGG